MTTLPDSKELSRESKKQVQEKIISAAGEVFAERGFREATVREITRRAGVNVAAVNYYFRDKEELYHCVLRASKAQCSELVDEDLSGGAEARLRAFVLRFVLHLLDPNRPEWHIKVLNQEMMNPTPAIDMLAGELVGPVFHRLCGIVAEIVGDDVPEAELHLMVASILGQCLFHRRSRALIERLAPEVCHGEDAPGRIAAHIADFSLAALRSLRPKPASRPAKAKARAQS
ncbi:MAG TPA: CerR family C-terminal domain-containing protein [Candidatus Methylacidiphilales bacterium]